MTTYQIKVVSPKDKFQEWGMTVDKTQLSIIVNYFMSVEGITKISVKKVRK